MLRGETPRTNWYGRQIRGGGAQLAGGWRATLCQLRGDWAFYTEVFGFPQWNAAERMCWLCRASSTIRPLAWTRMGPDAGWRETRWTHESYIEFLRAASLAIPVLLTSVVGSRLECVMVDVLHTVDQGVASHIIANIFWLLAVLRGVFGGRAQEERIANLFAHMKSWYKGWKPSSRLQGKLSVERVRTQGGWPKLKAKAAATRHLAEYALLLMQEFGTPEDRPVLAMSQLLCRFYQILSDESMFLGHDARRELPTVGRRLAMLYASVAEKAARDGIKMWKMHPKLHIFLHLCEWQGVEVGNPRFFWTYADEDLVGLLVEVAQSCHPHNTGGKCPLQVVASLLRLSRGGRARVRSGAPRAIDCQ